MRMLRNITGGGNSCNSVVSILSGVFNKFKKTDFTPVDDAKCVDTKPRYTKLGFTLAEVLITLGIIGVVAAITIPALVSNYQKTVWVSQLKKSYSTLSQGFRMMLADDNVDELGGTEAFSEMSLADCNPSDIMEEEFGDPCKNLIKALQKTFSGMTIIDIDRDDYHLKKLDGSDDLFAVIRDHNNKVFQFQDGSIIFNYSFSNSASASRIDIDINGINKGPNIWGRDVFRFYLFSEGAALVLPYSEDYWKRSLTPEMREMYKQVIEDVTNDSCSKDGDGDGCAARIFKEGKMNY